VTLGRKDLKGGGTWRRRRRRKKGLRQKNFYVSLIEKNIPHPMIHNK
jgi:hypothetical protein